MGPIPTPLQDIKNIKYQQEILEEYDILRCFCVCACSLCSVWNKLRKNVIWNTRRLKRFGQYLVPLWNIYRDIHMEHRSESHGCEMIADLRVWHLGYMLANLLYVYLESEMDLYVDNILHVDTKWIMIFRRMKQCHDTRFHYITTDDNTGNSRWILTGCSWNNWVSILWCLCWWIEIFTETWKIWWDIIWEELCFIWWYITCHKTWRWFPKFLKDRYWLWIITELQSTCNSG